MLVLSGVFSLLFLSQWNCITHVIQFNWYEQLWWKYSVSLLTVETDNSLLPLAFEVVRATTNNAGNICEFIHIFNLKWSCESRLKWWQVASLKGSPISFIILGDFVLGGNWNCFLRVMFIFDLDLNCSYGNILPLYCSIDLYFITISLKQKKSIASLCKSANFK